MVFRLIYAAIVVVFFAGIARAQAVNALDEVNAARAARGLAPFAKCPQLTAGAFNVAQFRAERLIKGHSSNDFAGLPPGASADASGCAGNAPSWGFMACAMFENWTQAGAAKIMGRDGNLYCQLFVRGSSTERISHASQAHFVPRSASRGRRR